MLFFSLFLVIPTVVRHWGLLVTWRFLLVYCVVQLGLTALCFHRAHRELYPEEGESRWTLVVTVFLSPPMAIRATDALMRDILCDIHPLAAARVLCNEEEFLALASRILREVEFPLPASDVSQENPTREWEEAYREKLWRALERFMARAGKNLHHLLGPPRRESEECKSYCPRCWNQYLIPSGVCLDCQGLPLRSFSDVSTAKPQPS